MDACAREIETIDSVLADFSADVLVGDTCTSSLYCRLELRGPSSAMISLLPLCLISRDTAPYGIGMLPGKSFVTRARNQLLNTLIYRMLMRDVNRYINDIRQQLGLGSMSSLPFRSMFEECGRVLQISTPAFEYPRSDQPKHIHFIGPILPESDRTFRSPPWWSDLKGPEPVVLVNQGTIATVLDDLVVPTIRGLKDQQVFVVAVPVKDGQLGKLPINVRAEPFIPFDRLLPFVDVMVTNGGYGATQLALAYGIPLVVAGETEDKREVAARVEWAGAGINLRKQRPSPEAVCEAVAEVLSNPIYRKNANKIQVDFAQYNAPVRAAELLEAFVGYK